MRWSEITGESVLAEMPMRSDMDKFSNQITRNHVDGHRAGGDHVGNIGPYAIYRNDDGPEYTNWWLNDDDDTDRPMMLLRTTRKGNEFTIYSLKGRPGSQVKAVDFYVWLVKQGYTLVSDDFQSEGGAKVWQRLSQQPGVKVTLRSEDGTIETEPATPWSLNYWEETRFVARRG